MKTNRPLALLAVAALLSVSTPVLADQIALAATLTAADEVPPTASTGNGALTATYDTDTNILTYEVTYSGLTGDATAAHFHGPAAPGENASPVVPVEGSLASPIAGSASLTDEQEADLLGGRWYFNVHTAANPGGEIRGQVLQANMAAGSSEPSEVSEPAEMSEPSAMSPADSSSQPSSSEQAASSSEPAVLPDVSTSTSVEISTSAEVSVPTP